MMKEPWTNGASASTEASDAVDEAANDAVADQMDVEVAPAKQRMFSEYYDDDVDVPLPDHVGEAIEGMSGVEQTDDQEHPQTGERMVE